MRRKPEHENKSLSKKMDRWIIFRLRGQPFDPKGRGLANLVGTDYLFSSFSRPENLNKQKKKKKKKHRGKGGGGGGGGGGSRGHSTWLFYVLYNFCRLLARNIVYSVSGMFWFWFFSVLMCIEMCLERGGGSRVLSHNFLSSIHTKWCYFYAIMMDTRTCTRTPVLWNNKKIYYFEMYR